MAMATEQEIEATMKLSEQLETKAAALLKQADDSSRSFAPLLEQQEKETTRFVEVLNAKAPPRGTGGACFTAAVELIGDWAEFEVAVEEGLGGAGGSAAKPASGGQKAPPRRGMRI